MRHRNNPKNRNNYLVVINGIATRVDNCHTRNAAVYKAAKALGRTTPKFNLKKSWWEDTLIMVLPKNESK